ncbi:MAG TPA: DNA methyltransferase [Bacillota bacterium]|nr:DNA methyltransferase [Bacillota bacterium]
MAKIDVTRTELVWPGKYNEDGTRKEVPRVNLPFQVIETVNESRATRVAKQGQQTIYDYYKGEEGSTFEEGWKNKLIWGDNLLVMSSLLEKFAGKIDLIYIDPPFATGADFKFNAQIGEEDLEVTKEHSIIEEKAYRDTWGKGLQTYLSMMYERLVIMRELISEEGSIYVHLDATVGHYVKLILDEVFGPNSFQREIVWRIGWISGYKSAAKNWIRNHDTILYYVKTPGRFTFNKEYIPYPAGYERRGGENPNGKGYPIEDVWNANTFEFNLKGEDSLDSIQIKSFSQEKTGYATQKNESILRRIINASSNPGDLVADFFSGSGTTLAVAEKLGRRWIGCDLSRWAIHVTRKRLLDIENCKPFEVLNLGKYERKYWQGVTFKEKSKEDQQVAIYQYIAFILKLYGAEPLTGTVHLHGKKGKAVVHVGAVDAPVTIDEIAACLDECEKLKLPELHVLGWEWEMGLAGPNNDYRRGGPMHDVAKGKGIKLYLFQIPREVMEQQAVEKGDIQFFELAYLEHEIKRPKKLAVQVILKDFVIPNYDLIPEEVRQKIKKWSDYIDYWAVDWNFQNDTFIQGWVTYRTRRDRTLKLASDVHTYEKPGKYRILIKVIDIFGNDTSQAIDVEVK